MAAYGALISVMHIVEQLERHPFPPITLDEQQVQSLTQKIAFFQDFLEVYNSHYSNQEVEPLRNRIADAAYAAEDVIESHIVDQIHAQSTNTHDRGNIGPVDFYQALQKEIENMDLIKKEVMEIKVKMGDQNELKKVTATPVIPSKAPPTQHNTMVGFDDAVEEMLDKLLGQLPERQIIPISGMGGIGKTTLARNLYMRTGVERHFEIRAWVTISQEYNIQEILVELLCQKNQASRETLTQMSERDLGEKLYKSLYGRRYLIVMDDMWNTDVWDKVKFFFPNDNKGSRIIITTRLSNVASYLSSGYGHEMNFLDQDKSWNLLCKTVFEEENCPSELEDIGMEIVRNCKGLPLSIVVLGGLLAKSEPTQEYWKSIAEKLSLNVHLEENERCLQLLYTSYEQLPVHLKAYFLYMGTFPEDSKIHVCELIRTLVAEGFLKPMSGKSLEESAENYLMDLIGRNLILVSQRGSSGKVRFCSMHDMLRDLCLREARKENFLCVTNHQVPHEDMITNTQCRIAIHQNESKEHRCGLKLALVTRSLISYFREDLPSPELKLLRVFKRIIGNDQYYECEGEYSLEDIFRLVNLRYLAMSFPRLKLIIPSSISLLWNLQTLESRNGINPPPKNWEMPVLSHLMGDVINLPDPPSPTIWEMPLLRHVIGDMINLPDPPNGPTEERDDLVLENLQTLSRVLNLKLDEEVVKRIPNVKKLKLYYCYIGEDDDVVSQYCLYNLGRLCKLESLYCCILVPSWPIRRDFLHKVTFPHSLKKLVISQTRLFWEDMSTKVGSLPHLEVLKLQYDACIGPWWGTKEGQFRSLRYLQMCHCEDLEDWTTESSHFPCLEHLVLQFIYRLTEIPEPIGEIPTLKSIQLESCSDSTISSAKAIQQEQEEVGNEGLQVVVQLGRMNIDLSCMATNNFVVKIW